MSLERFCEIPGLAKPLARAIAILCCCTGLVVLIESLLFVFSTARAHSFAKSGLPPLIRPVLGGAEVIAAILFLIPLTRMLGGRLLLLIFVLGTMGVQPRFVYSGF